MKTKKLNKFCFILTLFGLNFCPQLAISKHKPRPALFYEQNLGLKFQNENTLITPYSRRYGVALGNLFAGAGLDESHFQTQKNNFNYLKRSIYSSLFLGYNYHLNGNFFLSSLIGIGGVNNKDNTIEDYQYSSGSLIPEIKLSDFIPDINFDIRIGYKTKVDYQFLIGYQKIVTNGGKNNSSTLYVGLNYRCDILKYYNKDTTSEKKTNKYSLFLGTSNQQFGGYINYSIDEVDIDKKDTYLQLAEFTRVRPTPVNLLSIGVISNRNNLLYFSISKRDYFDIENYNYNPSKLNSSFIYKSTDIYTRLNYTLNAFSFFDKLNRTPLFPILDFSIFNVRKDLRINLQYDKEVNGNIVGENTIDMKVKSSLYLLQMNVGFGFRLKHLYGNVNLGLINRNFIDASVNRTINVYPNSNQPGINSNNKIGEYDMPEIQIKGSTEPKKYKDYKYKSITVGFVF